MPRSARRRSSSSRSIGPSVTACGSCPDASSPESCPGTRSTDCASCTRSRSGPETLRRPARRSPRASPVRRPALAAHRPGRRRADRRRARARVISNYAVGVDNVDVAAATARRIPVGHTPDVLTDSTADLAVALMLADRAPPARGRADRPLGPLGHLGPRLVPGPRPARLGGGDRRRRADREHGRAPARGLRLRGDPLRARAAAARAGARARRLRHRPHAAHRRHARADRRSRSCG